MHEVCQLLLWTLSVFVPLIQFLPERQWKDECIHLGIFCTCVFCVFLVLNYVCFWECSDVCMRYFARVPELCACVQSLPTVSHLWSKLKNNPAQDFPDQLGLVVSLPESLCPAGKKTGWQETKHWSGFCFSVEQIYPNWSRSSPHVFVPDVFCLWEPTIPREPRWLLTWGSLFIY